MKYTKGEWKVHWTQPEKDTPLEYKIMGKVGEICHVKQFGINSVETKANAHLIAAAPEMYGALKELYHQAPSTCTKPGDNCLKCRIMDILAKAEGRV